MERFAKIVNDFSPFTIFAKSSILDVWQGSECPSGVNVGAVVNHPQILKLSMSTEEDLETILFHTSL